MAATGPGCGGRNAWVMDRPASSGIAYSRIDLPERLAAAYTIGARTKMPTSKKTGIPKIRPVRPMASGARFSPKRFSSRVLNTSAPPETSRIAPSIVPRPMMIATWPRMPPMPDSMTETAADFCTVPKSSVTERPAPRPTAMETASRATNGCSLTLMIRKRRSAIPRTATVSRPAVPPMRRRSPPVWGGVSTGGGLAASSMGNSVVVHGFWVRRALRGSAARRPGGVGRRDRHGGALVRVRQGDQAQPRTARASISMSRPLGRPT